MNYRGSFCQCGNECRDVDDVYPKCPLLICDFFLLAFGEAFITTFRTFISPLELIEKLIHRHTIFYCQINDQKQKSAKESFSLLVRVVNDLT